MEGVTREPSRCHNSLFRTRRSATRSIGTETVRQTVCCCRMQNHHGSISSSHLDTFRDTLGARRSLNLPRFLGHLITRETV